MKVFSNQGMSPYCGGTVAQVSPDPEPPVYPHTRRRAYIPRVLCIQMHEAEPAYSCMQVLEVCIKGILCFDRVFINRSKDDGIQRSTSGWKIKRASRQRASSLHTLQPLQEAAVALTREIKVKIRTIDLQLCLCPIHYNRMRRLMQNHQ